MDVGILRLPNEMLIQIFEVDPGDPGVFSISTLCRRLHYLALPVYLTAHGVPDPQTLLSEDLILLSTQLHLLGPLQTALFIRSLKHLSCSFPLSSAHLQHFSRKEHGFHNNLFFYLVRRLTAFLANLERVNEVTLEFQRAYPVFTSSLEALNAWDSTISALLDVIMKKGCTALNVQGGMFAVHSSQFQFNPNPQRVIRIKRHVQSVMSVLGRRIASAFGRKAKVDKSLRSGKEQWGLRTFNIHSSILLLAPCYGWTMATLRASPYLTTLSIVCDDIQERDGDDILLNIHAPRLRNFFMDLSCSVTAPALDQFLARHPHISASNFGPRVRLPWGLAR
ncbi:hypothetical protein C8R45DRAFT_1204331 [Mycena sanguinolenta]|nr:hypothetical protein C8R45DRAFT_1204331 [Mycena sanguinolenta]